jgi:hypothetical protein
MAAYEIDLRLQVGRDVADSGSDFGGAAGSGQRPAAWHTINGASTAAGASCSRLCELPSGAGVRQPRGKTYTRRVLWQKRRIVRIFGVGVGQAHAHGTPKLDDIGSSGLPLTPPHSLAPSAPQSTGERQGIHPGRADCRFHFDDFTEWSSIAPKPCPEISLNRIKTPELTTHRTTLRAGLTPALSPR